MNPQDVWSELGIASTHDRNDVRRAYAQRLKQTHPEDDPEGFKRLRTAYEIALALADGRIVAVGDDAAATAADPSPEETASQAADAAPAPQPPAAPIGVDGAPDLLAEHWKRCSALIEKAAAGGADVELLADLHVILAAPIVENLEVFRATGLGLARALVGMSPRGDALVKAVVQHFGWRQEAAGWSAAPEVLQLVEIAETASQRAAVRESLAYADLREPPPDRMTSALRGRTGSILRLLEVANSEQGAWLRNELRSDTVDWWTRQLRRRGSAPRRAPSSGTLWTTWRVIWLILVIGGAIARCAPTFDTPDPPAAGVEAVTYPDEGSRLAATADALPNDAAAWAELCAATARGWWRKTSVADCDHAVAVQPPGATKTALDRAYFYIKLARSGEAEAQLDKLLAEEPKNALALYGRSLARANRNELRTGQRDWCKALKIDPGVRHEVEYAYDIKIAGAYEPCT